MIFFEKMKFYLSVWEKLIECLGYDFDNFFVFVLEFCIFFGSWGKDRLRGLI